MEAGAVLDMFYDPDLSSITDTADESNWQWIGS